MSNEDLAFGIDISRYQYSPDGKTKMDFEAVAANTNPFVSFVVCRSGISWGYQDPWFARSWAEIARIPEYRANLISTHAVAAFNDYKTRDTLVGRAAYHVIYPGENAISQADNLFRIIGDTADWNHDKLVIDAELDHGQSRRTITDAIKRFAYTCKERTGDFPILYSRTNWLYQFTFWEELWFMDMWVAQYRYAMPYPLYTPEYQSPPVLGYGTDGSSPRVVSRWLIHQTAEKGKSIGGASYYMDYNRWNGGREDVLSYFGYDEMADPTPAPVEPTDAEKLQRLWDAHPELH